MPSSNGPKKNPVALLIGLIAVAVVALGVQYRAHLRRMDQVTTDTQQENKAAGKSIPELVAEIDRRLDPVKFGYANRGRAVMGRNRLADKSNPLTAMDRTTWEVLVARELVNAGMTEEGVREWHAVNERIRREVPEDWAKEGSDLLVLEAVGYLRMGEEQNCCAANNPDSCLVPIAGHGVHTKQRGSRQAIKLLTDALQQKPNNLSARWLLNIAYMTIGEYPSKVPPQWLISPKVFGGEYPMKAWYNAAPDMGLDHLGWSGGAALEDFEGNGLLDIMISSLRPGEPMQYYRNNGDGTFTDRTKEAGLGGVTGGLNFITTDYNNDGKVDVVLLRGGWFGQVGHYPLSLLRNDGNGHFTDVTIEAGLLTLGPTQTAVAFDYNGDGFLDLFVGYETRDNDVVPCKLFRNNGDGTFTDVTETCGLHISRFVKAVISADFMHNGRPGLYISCAQGPDILLRNDGPVGPDKSPRAAWKFTDISHQAGVDKQKASFSCFFFDYDNDGWPDLYVGGYAASNVGQVAADYLGLPTPAEKSKLYRNNHDGTFTDVSKQAHLDRVNIGMGINFGDLDNDGWLDFYVGTGNPDLGMLIPNRMFRNHDGKYFDEVTGTGNFGHLQKGHGVAFGDVANDGQQDIFEEMGGAFEGDTAHNLFFVNPGSPNRWVTLQLTGVKSNRIAIGAEICVTVATPRGERRIYKTVGPGGSFGCNPMRQEIGLGEATAIKQVSIRWPASGVQQTVSGVAMNGFYKINEGDDKAVKWNPPTFKLPHGPSQRPEVARSH